MCGILGFVNKKKGGEISAQLTAGLNNLNRRGPNNQTLHKLSDQVYFGHARLSIIDLDERANQPFYTETKTHALIFNGEVYNYNEIRAELVEQAVPFSTSSDTEVVLKAYIQYGEACLDKFNGFFTFAVFNLVENTLFVTRDRLGIKPLYYYEDEECLAFSSELKALDMLSDKQIIDHAALSQYFQLSYIPATKTIFQHFKKLPIGCFFTYKNQAFKLKRYYHLKNQENNCSFNEAKTKLTALLEKSVSKRLVSDVPIGTFLSGGVDSSIISYLAKQQKPDLKTFSIGYKDNPFFDESKYAEIAAKAIGSQHESFMLSNADLLENLDDMLAYIDEPFADSSALAVYILCKHTSKKITVALSGDGADELFAGYNKHFAIYKALNPNWQNHVLALAQPILKLLPQSRNSRLGNFNRKLNRFNTQNKLSHEDRYLALCKFADEKYAQRLLKTRVQPFSYQEITAENYHYQLISDNLNDYLLADLKLVLPEDMLTKVDRMSMANSLEVRVPFLDHEVVEFALSMNESFKINSNDRKHILKEAFAPCFPKNFFNRPKHGFEVPLLEWFRNELYSRLFEDLLSKQFIEEQALFNFSELEHLRKQLKSNNPDDVSSKLWALLVFQSWWKRHYA